MADAEQVLAAWRAEIRAGWGNGAHEVTLDRLDPVLRDLVEGRADPGAALAAVGAAAGRDGHSLDLVWEWLRALFGRLPRSRQAELDQRDLAEAVASAWVDGILEGSSAAAPGRSPALLELPLRQMYDHCASLGLSADQQYALVVVEVAGAGAATEWLPAVVRLLADAVGRHDVVAVLRPHRVAMVVARHPSVAAAVQQLHTRLEELPALQDGVVHAWIEPLAPDPSHLGGHLAGLAS
jgi:hypothetical protein